MRWNQWNFMGPPIECGSVRGSIAETNQWRQGRLCILCATWRDASERGVHSLPGGVAMAAMSQRERLRAALAGQPVDRVPVALWGHDFAREFSAEGLADATIE